MSTAADLFATGTPVPDEPAPSSAAALFESAGQPVPAAPSEAASLFASAGTPADPAEAETEATFWRNAPISQAEVEAIARKNGADPASLVAAAPYYGAEIREPGGEEEFANRERRGLGFAGRALGMNIPQFVYKKLQDEPTRKALDEVQELATSRQATSQDILEAGAAVAGSVGLARGVAKGAARLGAARAGDAIKTYEAASAVGGAAAQGAATAKEGEELEEAAKGAVLGGAFYGLGRGVEALLDARAAGKAARSSAPDAAEASAERTLKELSPEVSEAIEQEGEQVVARATREADNIIASKAGDGPSVLERALALPEIPADPVALVRATMSPEEIAQRAAAIEKRFAEHSPEALAALSDIAPAGPEGRALRDATLVSMQVERELKHAARLAASGAESKAFEGSTLDALQMLKARAATDGVEYIEGLARKASVLTRANDLWTSGIVRRLDELDPDGKEPDFLARLSDMMRDGKFVARQIDRRLGTSVERTMDEFARQNNFYTRHLAALDPALSEVKALQKAAGFEDEAVYRALDQGLTAVEVGVPPEQAEAFEQVASGWREFFERVREEANELGLNIAKRENYVPHKTLPPRKLFARLDEAMDRVAAETGVDLAGGWTRQQYDEVLKKNETFGQLQEALEYLSGQRLRDSDSMRTAIRTAQDPSIAFEKLRTTAGATMERLEEAVPALIRETSMGDLASRWTTNTFRHAYLREVVDDMRLARDIAADSGDKRSAGYLHRLTQDIVGVPRKNTLADAIRRKALAAEVAVSRVVRTTDDPLVKAGAEGLLTVMDLMPTISNQMYPNFLGFSVRACLQNLTQPYLMAVPELGWGYGSVQALSANAQIASDLLNGRTLVVGSADMARMLADELGRPVALGEAVTTKNPRVWLESQGLLGRQWNTDLQNFLEQAVEEGAIGRVTRESLKKYNNAAMYLYERAELVNRLTISYMADGVSRDLVSEAPTDGALRFLDTLNTGYKRLVSDALQSGDKEKVQALVRDYMVGKTAFNYSRASMNEFGRSAGAIFSVFTKWPAHIAGDMLDSFQRQGAAAGATDVFARYMAPMLSLYIADKMLFGDGQEAKQNPFRSAFVGPTGLATWAPAKSVAAWSDGNLLQPPVIGAVLGAVKTAATMDVKEGAKWLDDTARAFVPGTALIRLLAVDLRAAQGEQPVRGTLATQIESLAE